MKLTNGIYRGKGIRRFAGITRVLVQHGFGDIVNRLFSRAGRDEANVKFSPSISRAGYISPARLRRILEELGPSFIKLGQLMSTRADLFPLEVTEELRKLQDSVPPVAFKSIKKVVEEELEQPIDRLFESFDETSIAAASVAQVHAAQLHTGEKVAVKIIRPGIGKVIREDVRLMYYFAEKIEKVFEVGRMIGAVNLVREFERTIFKELDMFIEAGAMEKFAANFEPIEEIHIPAVHWDYVSRSVLTMEHIDGIKMDQVDALVESGIDPKAVALIGLTNFSRQLMEFGLFHADPHPANTIVMYDGRVSFVDFGIIGYLDEEVMRQIANLFLGYAEHDYDMVMEALTDAGLVNEDEMDVADFRIDLKDISEQFYGRSLKRISVKDVNDQVMQLALKYRIKLPRNLLLLFKTLIQAEALGKILDSDASILEVSRPFAERMLHRSHEAHKVFKEMEVGIRSFRGYMKDLPKMLHDFLKQASKGQGGMEVRHTGLDLLGGKLEKGLNRLIVGMIISASIIAASLILNSSQRVLDLDIGILGINGISLTGLFGIIGYIIATLLGMWLIFSIFRSGKM